MTLSIPKLLVSLVALVAGIFVFRYAITQAIHTVIEAQPPPAKVEPVQFPSWEGCKIDVTGRSSPRPGRCRFQIPARIPEPIPIQTMSKEQSETASLWFVLAALALPLSLGAAALGSFLLFRAQRSDGTDFE